MHVWDCLLKIHQQMTGYNSVALCGKKNNRANDFVRYAVLLEKLHTYETLCSGL